jgi:hypothetical protein
MKNKKQRKRYYKQLIKNLPKKIGETRDKDITEMFTKASLFYSKLAKTGFLCLSDYKKIFK